MSNEIIVNGRLDYYDSEGTADVLELKNFLASVTTKAPLRVKQSIATTETALKLGGITNLGWFLLVNRDTTNYVSFRRATGETEAFRIPPGGLLLGYAGTASQAPYLIANTAACQVEGLLTSQ